MKKNLKYIFIIFAVLLFGITANANEEYNINYVFGVADIRSEYIINENPDSYIKGQTLELADPSCSGFEFKGWFTDDSHNNEIKLIDSSMTGDITLYAKWYEMSYNINYVLTSQNIGLNEDDITNYNPVSRRASESTFIYAPMCNTGNYTFEGWYLDKNLTQKVSHIDSYTCTDVTLYAKWSNTSYPIYYDLGEAEKSSYITENPNPDFYEYGAQLILKDAKTDDPSFIFDGWYADSGFREKITSIPAETSGSIVIYAKWIIKTFNISYILTDNSGIAESSISNGNSSSRTSVEDFVLNDPISNDKSFKFDGWYTVPTFETNSKITVIKAGTNNDITLYAKWVPAVYKIKYNYGIINQSYLRIDNPNPTEYRFKDNTTLLPIEADGFIFNGWFTDNTLKNKVDAIPADTYGDITLYADFTEKTYSITYILDGNGIDASKVVNRNDVYVRTTTEQISLKEAQSIDSAYVFDGWYLDSEYTQEIEYIRAYTTGNITLYAKWLKEVSYIPVWGDVTLSDKISAADARLALRYAAKLETAFTEVQFKVSDINNDSGVNAADARIILRLSANLEKEEDLIKKYNLPEIAVENGEIIFK